MYLEGWTVAALHTTVEKLADLTELVAYLRRYGESSQGVPIQYVRPCIINDDIRSDLIKCSLRVELDLLQVLRIFSAPVQLHLPFYGS